MEPLNQQLFPEFNPFNNNTKNINKTEKKYSIKPYIGSALGVGLATLAFYNQKNRTDSFLHNSVNKLKLGARGKKTILDVTELISTAAMANIGSVLINSKGKTKEQKNAKWKEAGFQIMNMALPMLMVTGALRTCESIKKLNTVPVKIGASILGMVSGACLATKITNSSKKQEDKRKYTIKDSIANFDDIVATVKLGFEKVENYIPVSKILPFIYIYSGARAGAKDDNRN